VTVQLLRRRAATAGDRRMGERRGLLVDGADDVRCGGGELRAGFRAGRAAVRGGVDAGGGRRPGREE
jgi:hypothetical protein